MQVKTLEDFKAHVKSLQEAEGYARPLAFGVGVRRSKGGKTLDVTFPHLNKESNYGSAAILASISGFTGGSNGFATLDRAQLAQAYETFAPYHHETEGHFNMKVLKTLSEVARDGEGYADVDVIVCDPPKLANLDQTRGPNKIGERSMDTSRGWSDVEWNAAPILEDF